eukprot:1491870-Prorocentrum_lima.AAC.1
MTSSLVGSEMCIRDRLRRVSEVVATAASAELLHMETVLEPDRKGIRAVSYTHLTLPTICSV